MSSTTIVVRIGEHPAETRRGRIGSPPPLQEGAAQLRAQVYESAVKMHEALTRNEFLPGATVRKARNMAHWFKLMNFQSDKELDQLITSLERLAAKRPRQHN